MTSPKLDLKSLAAFVALCALAYVAVYLLKGGKCSGNIVIGDAIKVASCPR